MKQRRMTSELQIHGLDGSLRLIEVRSQLVQFEGKDLVLVISRDITERKKAEEELALRAMLLDAATDAILLYDVEGNILYANDAMCRSYRMKREQMHHIDYLGQSLINPNRYKERIEQIRQNKALVFEIERHRPDETISQIEVRSQLVQIAGKELILTMARDITKRKKAEEELERRAMLLDATTDPILLYDLEGNILFANKAMYQAYGVKREQPLNWNTLDKSLTDPGHFQTRIEEIRKNGILTFEIGRRDTDGTIKSVEVRAQVIQLGGNELILSTSRDITERKKMQEKLIIADRLASIGELTSGMAHELNNPLTSVIGFADLLLEKELPADIKENITYMCREAKRTSEVVKNMLTFARKHPIIKQPVDINDIVSKVLEMRKFEHNNNNIQVIRQLANDLPNIKADYFQLQQAILNIIINAEYFMKEAHGNGILTVTTEKVNQQC